MTDKDIVIFDLDGTLALDAHRRHLIPPKGVEDEKERWNEYFMAAHADPPNDPIITIWNALGTPGLKRWIMTGRSDITYEITRKWFDWHSIEPDRLFMRPKKDMTRDIDLKARWALPHLARIRMVFEDRAKVVAMWRDLGIPCLQVAPGDF